MMNIILQVEGMTCTGCETRIENAVKKLDGIEKVKAIYNSSNVYVTYNADAIKLKTIIDTIEKLNYTVKNKPTDTTNNIKTSNISNNEPEWPGVGQIAGIAVIVLALYVIIKNTIGFNFVPEVNQSMGYGILFFIGLLTSLHCVAMCGGINLSVCVRHKASDGDSKLDRLKPSLLYSVGRVISYTIIGGIVGGIGSVVSFSGAAKGLVAILSGIFMVIMGINMLNIIPALKKFNPRMPKIFAKKVHENSGNRGPLVVGLLNGLMPCGPLQAMQLYALGTGSAMTGALSMFLFSLGTVPLMFGFGAVSSFLSSKFTHKMMKVSAVLVLLLGIIMLNRGLSLSGFNTNPVFGASSTQGGVAKIEGNVQIVTTKLDSGRYSPITVQKGIPVRWIITAESKDINGCNNRLNIPEYNIENMPLKAGENVIDFTPDREGKFVYSCWMGMISSNIKVVSDVSSLRDEDVTDNSDSQGAASSSGGCCGAASKATRFANGKIPTDEVAISKINGDKQEVTVTVNDYGYSPAVVILQKGIPATIKFNTDKLNICNSIVVFPEYQAQMDLKNEKETPELSPTLDFTFQCGMGMLHGYVKVVDNINTINIEEIKNQVNSYTPSAGSSAGGCCG